MTFKKIFFYPIAFIAGVCVSVIPIFVSVMFVAAVFMPTPVHTVSKSINLDLQNSIPESVLLEHRIADAINKEFPYAKNTNFIAFWIVSASRTHEVSPILLTAIIAQESSFRANVRSHVGAVGYGQVIPRFWQDKCGLDVTVPENNIWCSALALKMYIESTDNQDRALAHYNVGRQNYRNKIEYREAGHRYARSVGHYGNKFLNHVETQSFVF